MDVFHRHRWNAVTAALRVMFSFNWK